MIRERVYSTSDGRMLDVKSCDTCPLRDECEQREIPYKARGRKPAINKECKLPLRPPHKKGRKKGVKLEPVKQRKPKEKKKVAAPVEPKPKKSGRPAKSGTRDVCKWCGQAYGPETQTLIIVGAKVTASYGHADCMREDVRTEKATQG